MTAAFSGLRRARRILYGQYVAACDPSCSSRSRPRPIDAVVVAAFDRFGRSVRHLVESMDLFRHLGVEFISLREQIDTGSTLGQAAFTIIAALAQLERSFIVEGEGRAPAVDISLDGHERLNV